MIKKFILLSLLVLFAVTQTVYAEPQSFSERKANLAEFSAIRVGYGTGTVRIVLDLTQKVAIKESYVENPSRMIVDLQNTWLNPNVQREIELKSTVGKKIRIAQFDPSTVRLVIESMAETKLFFLPGGKSGQRLIIDLGNAEFKEDPELNKNNAQREKDLQAQREKEAQAQREKELQAQREKEAQAQREHELKIQREKELQAQREKELQAQREKELQAQREKELQAQREKELQAQREKELQAQREKELQAQREKELQAQREKEAQAQREHELKIQREKELQDQKERELERREQELKQREQAQREKELQAQRERELQAQQKREKELEEREKELEKREQAQREKEIKAQREQEIQAQRERDRERLEQEKREKKEREKLEKEQREREKREKKEREKLEKEQRDRDKKESKDADKDRESKPSTDLDEDLETLTALKGKLIVIDPGHGGNDAGAIGPTGVMEKTVTLKVAKELRKLLEAEGARVIMTREGDTTVSAKGAKASDIEELGARCDVANKNGADIFISIHADSFTRPEARGTTGYYYSKSTTGNGQKLADCIRRNLVEQLGTPSRGTQPCNFYVVKNTDMPATLIELGFISNAEEEKLLDSEDGVKRAAQGILDGIEDYFG